MMVVSHIFYIFFNIIYNNYQNLIDMNFIYFVKKYSGKRLIGLENCFIFKHDKTGKIIVLMGEHHYTDLMSSDDDNINYQEFISDLLENVDDINFTLEMPFNSFDKNNVDDDIKMDQKTQFKNDLIKNHKQFKTKIIPTDTRHTMEEEYDEQFHKQNALVSLLSTNISTESLQNTHKLLYNMFIGRIDTFTKYTLATLSKNILDNTDKKLINDVINLMLYIDNVDGQHINILQQIQHIINLYVEQMSVLYSFSIDEINTLKTTFVDDFSKQKETIGAIENSIPDGDVKQKFKMFKDMYFTNEFNFPNQIDVYNKFDKQAYSTYFTWSCINNLCSIPFHIHNILTSCYLVSDKKYNFHFGGAKHMPFIGKILIQYFDFKVVKDFTSSSEKTAFTFSFDEYNPDDFQLFDYLNQFDIYTNKSETTQQSKLSMNMDHFIRTVSK
jgi:hypothetical protein